MRYEVRVLVIGVIVLERLMWGLPGLGPREAQTQANTNLLLQMGVFTLDASNKGIARTFAHSRNVDWANPKRRSRTDLWEG